MTNLNNIQREILDFFRRCSGGLMRPEQGAMPDVDYLLNGQLLTVSSDGQRVEITPEGRLASEAKVEMSLFQVFDQPWKDDAGGGADHERRRAGAAGGAA